MAEDNEETNIFEEEASQVFENQTNIILVDDSIVEDEKNDIPAVKKGEVETPKAVDAKENLKKAMSGRNVDLSDIHKGQIREVEQPIKASEKLGGKDRQKGHNPSEASLASFIQRIQKAEKEISTISYVFDMQNQSVDQVTKFIKDLDEKVDVLQGMVEELDESDFDDEDELNDFKLIDVDVEEITRRVVKKISLEKSGDSEPENKRKTTLSKTVLYNIIAMWGVVLLMGAFLVFSNIDKLNSYIAEDKKESPLRVGSKVTLKKGTIIKCGKSKIKLKVDYETNILGKTGQYYYFELNNDKTKCEVLKFN